MASTASYPQWPHGSRAAIALTLDNMGEAADLNRGLWPSAEPIGKHYSVVEVLPKILALLKKYDVHATYFIESFNLKHYASAVADQVAAAGHEVAWHGWQHEAWSKLDEQAERDNFERSFGADGMGGFLAGAGKNKVAPYRGFRPPGGIVHGHRTLALCSLYGLGYISPAAERAAMLDLDDKRNRIVILPFKWCTVDAYYYMEAFAGLRKLKGETTASVLSEDVLVERYVREIDGAIRDGQFLSLLFHPFLTHSVARLSAMERIIQYLARKRDEGTIFLARCRDIEDHIRKYPDTVGDDPVWDASQWR